MPRPTGRIAGIFALVLLLAVIVRPQAETIPSAISAAHLPLAPSASLMLGSCPSVAQRVQYESVDCLQATRLDLIYGAIDLGQAIERLEACAGGERQDLAEMARRSAEIRADTYTARLTFGETLDPLEREELEALEEELGRSRRLAGEAVVNRLRAAGITPAGFDATPERGLLRRLTASESLRADFRAAFGDRRADDLEAIVLPPTERNPSSVVLGSTVLVPNAPVGTEDWAVSTLDAPRGDPRIVSGEVYATRLLTDLRRLEVERRRFLESGALRHQRMGSVGVFLTSVRRFGADDEEEVRVREESEADGQALIRRYVSLERTLGIDPLLGRMSGESVGLVGAIDRGCGGVALKRRRWIHTGAGVVTGLVGAAGLVVATGATGTMLGGVTIAAALEASLGAYLVARSERVSPALLAAARREAPLPQEFEERRFARRPSGIDAGDGNPGAGGREYDLWSPEAGEARESDQIAGLGVEEESEESTIAGARENSIPPILPLEDPEEVRELPPLLAGDDLKELRDLSLPEIQERIDEFLALRDPRSWADLAESEEGLETLSLEEMIEEARASLKLWEERRELSDRFGPFFIQAEIQAAPQRNRQEILMTTMGRYLSDRAAFAGIRDVEDTRRRVAERLVTHCRAGQAAGDLILTACRDQTALSILIIAALRDGDVAPPGGTVLGVQAMGSHFEAVLYSRSANQVFSLNRGRWTEGVVAPIYHPATLYAGFLEGQGIDPQIDADRHLLIALPDRAMPIESLAEECSPDDDRSTVGRAVEWLGSMVGVRRISRNDECGPRDDGRARPSQGRGVNVDVSLPRPRNPLARSGGGQSGNGQGGSGGSGGGQPDAAGAQPAGSSGGESGNSGQSGGDGSGQGQSASGGQGDGDEVASGEKSDGGSSGDDPLASGDAQGGSGTGGDSQGTGARAENSGASATSEGSESRGTGGSGGFGVGNAPGAPSPDLVGIGREAIDVSARAARAGSLRVTPWRLRSDEGMATGSTSGVLYADNPRALERFGEEDLFITLAPAEVEAQRRMLEADLQPIYPAQTDCGSAALPPLRVFRREASGEAGFRYVYCDQNETMVIFRERRDADSYAALAAPDRPLYVARLAARRLESFERSPDMGRLQAFLDDPNVVRDYSRDEIYGMAKTAGDLLVFQNTLESALIQSMNELGPSGIRGYYYDMHRQVLQAPLFIRLAERVHRLNQRLASDPLQSLAWANAQERPARQAFFELYYILGGVMDWPERWVVLQQRYGTDSGGPPATRRDGPSLDFLQVMSDPQRVRVDWRAERTGRPSIRDRQAQDGAARSTIPRPLPTLSEKEDLQEITEHLRGGTGGLGDAGDGDSIGPESGRRPLQMIRIRMVPDDGDPDRMRLPDDNQVRPGGTIGDQKKQTEESATRQEPVLWLAPQTFIDAILSTWDRRDFQQPVAATRVPSIVRFNEPLRELFLRDLRPTGVYENRLRGAMEVFTAGGWLRYAEVRHAMGGSWVTVRAKDTGRFSAAYSGNAPINDEAQIRIPNFFSTAGVVLPADLFEPVRQHYSRAVLGIFDLAPDGRVPDPIPLRSAPVAPGEASQQGRVTMMRSLETIREQATERD